MSFSMESFHRFNWNKIFYCALLYWFYTNLHKSPTSKRPRLGWVLFSKLPTLDNKSFTKKRSQISEVFLVLKIIEQNEVFLWHNGIWRWGQVILCSVLSHCIRILVRNVEWIHDFWKGGSLSYESGFVFTRKAPHCSDSIFVVSY